MTGAHKGEGGRAQRAASKNGGDEGERASGEGGRGVRRVAKKAGGEGEPEGADAEGEPSGRSVGGGAGRSAGGAVARFVDELNQSEWGSFLAFVAVWVLLNVCMNARWPAYRFHDPHSLWPLPSPDLTVVFGLFCLLGWRGRRLPSVVMGALVGLILLCRVLRFGDGTTGRMFNRTFSVIADAPLVSDLVRVAWSTTKHWMVLLGVIGVVVLFVALAVGAWFALRYVEGYLARPKGRLAFAAIVALCLVLSAVLPAPRLPNHRRGAFATSAVMRLAIETDFVLHMVGVRDGRWRPLRAASARVEAQPAKLPRLGSADVLLFFVESYGNVAVSEPEVRAGIEPAWRRTERDLAAAGYGIRSSTLTAPVYGGGSWLAHATLAGGARIDNQFDYQLLIGSGFKTMAWAFRRAGYRSVLAAPAVTREWLHEPYFDFEKVYHFSDFDYHGPTFSWATMADQYVVDFIHRREVGARHDRPLFVQYELVSSHGPFDVQPPLFDDWSRLGDGSIYNTVKPVSFPGLLWSEQQLARGAYARSISYDFDVLTQYMTRFLEGRALVIALGDHQPTPELTGRDPSWAVPIHVFSRNPELLAPFERRGYGAGMTPSGDPQPMESLLFTLFEDFSH